MPQLERSNKWFVRVTLPHVILKEKIGSIMWVDVTRILALTHVGEKSESEHMHFVVELTSELQKQSMLARVKAIYGVSGNEQLSAKAWDGDTDACSYLFHDADAQVILNKGFSEEDLNRFRTRNEEVRKIVEENKKRASIRCVDRAVQAISAGELTRDYKPITMFILKLIRAGEMYEPGDFQLKKYVEEIMSKSAGGGLWQAYAEYRANKLFPDY